MFGSLSGGLIPEDGWALVKKVSASKSTFCFEFRSHDYVSLLDPNDCSWIGTHFAVAGKVTRYYSASLALHPVRVE